MTKHNAKLFQKNRKIQNVVASLPGNYPTEYEDGCEYGAATTCSVEYHPQRYPTHNEKGNPFKGQVYDGECNTTRCTNLGAQYWNYGTFGLYCRACADGINFHPLEPQVCIYVEEKPSMEKMGEMHTAYMERFAKSQGW